MAIDGRDIGRDKRDTGPAEGPGPRIIATLIVVVPAIALVAVVYGIGTWTGGAIGGVLSVVSTALTVAVLWLLARRKRR